MSRTLLVIETSYIYSLVRQGKIQNERTLTSNTEMKLKGTIHSLSTKINDCL